jgi:hypothetical protein
MNSKNNLWLEGYVFALSEEKYSYTIIKKRCENIGIKVSTFKISHILNLKGKKRQAIFLTGKKPKNDYPKKVCSSFNISKVSTHVLKENPTPQRTIAKSLGTSIGTINKIINKDLNLIKAKKYKVHRLLPRHVTERKTRCRLLYEKHLAGERWKYVVTIDEAWIYLNDCNKKRSIYYRKRGETDFSNWYKESKESFSKGFMVIAGISYNGKIKIRKIDKNVKINSAYYQTNVLTPIYKEDIPSLYANNLEKVELHQDKASSHTSKSTAIFLEKMQIETGIKSIPFKHIPAKSPDVAPMDYCAFGLLKQGLYKRRPKTLAGLWKAVEEEWNKIPIFVLRKALLSWKTRCQMIVQRQGYQIEHIRK